MSERRRRHRIGHRMVARFEYQGKNVVAAVVNFSEVGLFLQTDRILDGGSKLNLLVGSGQMLHVQGEVIWCRPENFGADARNPVGMGIHLSAVSPEWQELVKTLRAKMEDAPRTATDERFELYHRVRFEWKGVHYSEFTENISRGGLYLATDAPIPEGASFAGQLEIPGVEGLIEFAAVVKYPLPPEKAAATGRLAGLGVKFTTIESQAQERLHHYLIRIGIHRSRARRRVTNEIPLAGSLSDYLVPELLVTCLALEETGTLTFERAGLIKNIYMRKGVPFYVESPLRTETLGRYLLRHGKISAAALEESLGELAQGDMHHGEILLKNGAIDGAALAEALVGAQEEKLTNTFSWFDGEFRFSRGPNWPPNVGVFPLRLYHIVFAGIERWYDPPLINAWIGIDPTTLIRRSKVAIPPDASFPPMILRVLNRIAEPTRCENLVQELKLPMEKLLPLVFGAVLVGWVEIEFTVRPKKEAQAKKPPPKAAAEEIRSLARRVEDDFERFRVLNFYELFGIQPGAPDAALERAFVDRSSRYPVVVIDQLPTEEIQAKARQILSWIRVAYDTLRDPNLRHAYARRGGRKPPKDARGDRMEAERLMFSSIREIESGKFAEASKSLRKALELSPLDSTIAGFLGWSMFEENRTKNLQRAIELLDQAITRDPSDAQLHFFRGQIDAHLTNWRGAERRFSYAVKLNPRFTKAAAALDQARAKRIALDRLNREA